MEIMKRQRHDKPMIFKIRTTTSNGSVNGIENINDN